MTWFGSPAYVLVAGAIVLAVLLVDWWLQHIGWIVRNHRRVPHRKLRAAASARRGPATGVHAPRNPPVAGLQLHAPRNVPVAPPQSQADAHTVQAWTRDSTDRATGVESLPAPVRQPGAGTQHRAGHLQGGVPTARRGSAPCVEPHPVPAVGSAAGTGPKQPVGVGAPDPTPTGVHSPLGEVEGAKPCTVAVQGPLQTSANPIVDTGAAGPNTHAAPAQDAV